MSTHATLSPSKSHRWMACPGSIREESKYPDKPFGKAAIDGTHTHTLLEHLVNATYNPTEPTAKFVKVGDVLEDHEGSFTVDQERMDRVNVALKYISDRVKEHGETRVIAEGRTDPGAFLNRDDLNGTADVTLVAHGTLEIIDYKDGMGVVEPDSPQLKIYGFGRLTEYCDPTAGDTHLPFDTVRLTIVQPKLEVKGLDAVRYVDMPAEELFEWGINELADAAEKTDDPDAPLVAGNHCKWCKAEGKCQAQTAKVFELVTGDAEKVTDVAETVAQRNADELSDETILEIMELAPLVKSFLGAIEDEGLSRFKSGHAIPGLKVVHGRGKTEWKNDVDIEKVLKNMHVPKDILYPSKLISTAQIKKAKWKKKKAGEEVTASLSKRQLERLESEYMEKTPGALKVVLESAPGKAVIMDAETAFAGVEVQPPAEPEKPVEIVHEPVTEPEKPSLPSWMAPVGE